MTFLHSQLEGAPGTPKPRRRSSVGGAGAGTELVAAGRSLSPAHRGPRRSSTGSTEDPALHKELAVRVAPYFDTESRRLYSPVAARGDAEVGSGRAGVA